MKGKSVIVATEKHGIRVISGKDIEDAAKKLVIGRIKDGYWYVERGETSAAKKAISDNKCWHFLQSRSSYEYEKVDICEVE